LRGKKVKALRHAARATLGRSLVKAVYGGKTVTYVDRDLTKEEQEMMKDPKAVDPRRVLATIREKVVYPSEFRAAKREVKRK